MAYSSFYDADVNSEEVQRILKEQYNPKHKDVGPYKMECHHCGKSFFALHPSARYCSYRCTNDSYIARRKVRREVARRKECGNCSITFVAKRNDAKYCSPACRQAAYRKRSVTETGYS
ncbi:hypothetical protein [Sporosarcina obsidiansis]|uniref:hypothetical protein n=1 Tax=Sporosarcina obsidiansis TaxID=2660748 RepID=UPI00129BD29D|nr:hypothetical protein [Sporosarcina obsidiansis]